MPNIREAAKKLSEKSEEDSKISEKFEEIDSIQKDSSIKEGFLSKKLEEKRPGKVAGVDGGLLKKRYSVGDIVCSRAVGALFDFSGNGSVSADYIPSKNPDPEFFVFDQDDSDSLDKKAEEKRLDKEVKVARESLREAKVFMDGSIVPSYLESDETIKRYEELLEKADQGQLVGVVEDSYGLKMSSVLEEKLDIEIGDVRDTILMDSVLEEGERSFVRRYSDSPVEHPVLQKIKDKEANKLNTFYVKLSEKDLPLRVDFYGKKEDADTIAGEMLYMKASDSYTVPSPILEADKRAKIPEKYLKRLEKRFSPALRRRDRRRF